MSPAAERMVIHAELPGYTNRKILIKDFSRELLVEMILEGMIEGEELVIEEKAIGKQMKSPGLNLIEKEVIQSAGKMGIIEDVMNAVSVMPGVIYNGGFSSYFSCARK